MDTVNTIGLVSATDSNIESVRLYPNRAEVTRRFEFVAETGQNCVTITGLPRSFDRRSVKADGNGAVNILGVSVSSPPDQYPNAPLTSTRLNELYLRKEELESVVQTCGRSQSFLDRYMESIASQANPANLFDNNGTSLMGKALQDYHDQAADINARVSDAKQDIKAIEDEIEVERDRLDSLNDDHSSGPCIQVQLMLFTDMTDEVELMVTYTVSGASWTPRYEMRADTHAKEKQVKLWYKAVVTQNTGETWDNVSLILETATPTFNVDIPTLQPWLLSVRQDRKQANVDTQRTIAVPGRSSSRPRTRSRSPPVGYHRHRVAGSRRERPQSPPPPWYRRRRSSVRSKKSRSPSPDSLASGRSMSTSPPEIDGPVLVMPPSPIPPPRVTFLNSYPGLDKAANGGVVATYCVPGLVSVTNEEKCQVTIVQLELDASFSWISVPKEDSRVYFQAFIQNDSEYALIPGICDIYVDGNPIAQYFIPVVSLQENFECPLGMDPSVQINYHPRIKRSSKGGFLPNSKSTIHEFSQKITIINWKRSAVSKLTVIDQVPISEDPQITVKLLDPSLSMPALLTSSIGLGQQQRTIVTIGDGISALWLKDSHVNNSEPDSDAGHGKDGRLCWLCSIPSQGKIDLNLQWEVNVPMNATILGL